LKNVPALLTAGFGTAVAMWATGYVGRLPGVLLPGPLLFALLLGCLLAGGFVLGRRAGLGFWHGAGAGTVAGLLNLLVLGSLLTGGATSRAAVLWVPGSILLCALFAAAGSAAGAARPSGTVADGSWVPAFARVAIGAALLLVGIGGVVTSADAGLAVADWPNTLGQNMFLYPLSRMTGGIYYEHSHRLFGALVGLTTLTLAVLLQLCEPRRYVRTLGWILALLVAVQGALGGLRVTGHFTLSEDPASMRPNLTLALVHGILAQVFLGLLVAVGVFTSESWRRARGDARDPGSRADRLLGTALVALMLGQLVLGAAQRHFGRLVLVHVLVGVALVLPFGVHAGFRAWALDPGHRALRRLGLGLVLGLGFQVALGLAAFALTVPDGVTAGPAATVVATAHQWMGAVLLTLAVALRCWQAVAGAGLAGRKDACEGARATV
jgi:cytochrome c oxidase assembly protein subunit 15